MIFAAWRAAKMWQENEKERVRQQGVEQGVEQGVAQGEARVALELQAVLIQQGIELTPEIQAVIQRCSSNGNGSNGNGQY